MDANLRRNRQELFHRKFAAEDAISRESESDKFSWAVAVGSHGTETKEEKWGTRLADT